MTTIRTNRTQGFFPVLLALFGNIFITVIKAIGFLISGSGASFSETIHSFADTANQSLLLVGLKNSKRKADETFSYGYGKERFFWALISACGIFFIGAGVTVYHGIELLASHEVPDIQPLVLFIFALSFIIELGTLLVALWELKTHHRHTPFLEALTHGDPTTIAVIYEDGVAVLGVAVALTSMMLTKYTDDPIWDAIGSIIIGILLGVVAVILIRKNRKYLIGVTIPEVVQQRIIELLEADPAIDRVIDFKSSVLDIGVYHIKCEVEFNGTALLRDSVIDENMEESFEEIRNDYSQFIRFLVGHMGRTPRLIGTYIDGIEKRIQEQIPEIRHIDIELN